MKVSIIIPAFNEEKLLPATLRSIDTAREAFHQRGWASELIVCDNNSTDRTAEIARAGGANVVFEPVNQIARARNAGASAATGEWLVFVDADSQASRELFNDVADAILSGKYVGGGTTMTTDHWYLSAWIATTLWGLISRARKWCAGSFIFCEAEAFRAIRGFDEALFVSEEIDFSERLKAHARTRQKRLVILTRHPLVTSTRKLVLYGRRAHFRFLGRLILSRGAVLRRREDCAIWYDGRR